MPSLPGQRPRRWGRGSHGRWVALTQVGAVRDDEPLLPVLQPCGHGQAVSLHGSWPSSHPGRGSTEAPRGVPSPHGLSPPPPPRKTPPGISLQGLCPGTSCFSCPRVRFPRTLPAPALNLSPEAETRFLLGRHQGVRAVASGQPSQGAVAQTPGWWPRSSPCLPPAPRNHNLPAGVMGPLGSESWLGGCIENQVPGPLPDFLEVSLQGHLSPVS